MSTSVIDNAEVKTYNLRGLAEEIAQRAGTDVKVEEGHLKGTLGIIMELVTRGHTVRITGFATIEQV